MATKRSRITFTVEQKQGMEKLAQEVGWGLKKRDAALVEERCRKIGVRRDSFRFWLRNHKRDLAGDHSTIRERSIGGGPSAAATAASAGDALQHHRRAIEFLKVFVSCRLEKELLVPPVAAKVVVPSVELKVRLRWGEMMKTWLVRVAVDAEIGDMYLRDGWAVFVQANDIHIGDFLSFTYYKEAGVLGVKVFDTTSCRVFFSDAGRSSTHLLKQKGL